MNMWKEAFPSGQSRKEAIAEKEDLKVKLKKSGENGFADGHYTWLDSPLDGNGRYSFQGTFNEVLPSAADGDISLKKYIERTLAKRHGSAIGIEFGGTGSRVFSEFTPGFFKKSIGVTLIDHMKSNLYAYRDRVKRDKKRNHEVVESDIFSPDLYKSLEEQLGGEKVDFIVERMAAGLESVPPDPYLIGKFLNNWYQLLGEEGLLFAQVPIAFNPLLQPWTDMIRERYGEVIEVESKRGYADDGGDRPSVLRLRKLPGAPEKLPVLDPRMVRSISRQNA